VRLVAAKALHIKTQAGARISIEGGNIEIHAPGTLTIHKSSLNKQGPESLSVAMQGMPKSQMNFDDRFIAREEGGSELKNLAYVIRDSQGHTVKSGVTDAEGNLTGLQDLSPQPYSIEFLKKAAS